MAEQTEKKSNGSVAGRGSVSLAPSFGDHVVYADGVQALSLRGGLVHLDLYQLLPGGKASARLVSHRVVLPTAAASELLKMLQAAAKQTAAKQAEGPTQPKGSAKN